MAKVQNVQWPQNGIVYVVETQDKIFWSQRKLDATYKHTQFRYKDRVRYREVDAARSTPPDNKELIHLGTEPLVEVR